jgi:hypothetical protein
VIFSLEREKWWGFFMGWVLKGSWQKLVVCRYEEELARGVSVVKCRAEISDTAPTFGGRTF